MSTPRDRLVQVRGETLHMRQWDEAGIPFVLVHGLASNCLTWEAVARQLNAAGHPVTAVDQRGHGLSSKPATGYSFSEVTADLKALIDELGYQRPVVAGQSWGGNVVLDFAARYPEVPGSIALVDGGFLEPSAWPDMTWERISVDLKPPPLAGTPRPQMLEWLHKGHPDWSDEGIEGTMRNFETLPDGTIRPWLTLDRHMEILRSLWEHHPSELYEQVAAPVAIYPAEDSGGPRFEQKQATVALAESRLKRCRVEWFRETSHDIHVHRPEALAASLLQALADGFYDPE